MRKRSRSESGPRLGEGGVEGSALRAALGSRGLRQFRPYRMDEAFDAADMLAADRGIDRDLARIGISLDLICGARRLPKTRLCIALRMDRDLVELNELIWESLEPMFRFDIVRAAVQVIAARRLSERGGRR